MLHKPCQVWILYWFVWLLTELICCPWKSYWAHKYSKTNQFCSWNDWVGHWEIICAVLVVLFSVDKHNCPSPFLPSVKLQISLSFEKTWFLLFGLSIERPILDHHPKVSHSWNPADFRWNPADFMKSVKSGRFHPWNPVDFTPEFQWISPQISPVKSTQNYKSKCFSKNSSVWWMQGGGFHPWNPMDFTHEIHQISPRFDLWNPPKIIKASVLAKTLQFDECRVGDFTLEIWWISPWNLVDFNHEIWWISPRYHPVKSTPKL